jgi:hypothetical protein
MQISLINVSVAIGVRMAYNRVAKWRFKGIVEYQTRLLLEEE